MPVRLRATGDRGGANRIMEQENRSGNAREWKESEGNGARTHKIKV